MSSETKQLIASTMKQMGSSMDILEKKHYESKISKLEQEIDQAQQNDQRVTMDQLMLNVGLSPSLKDTIGKTMLFNADSFSSPNGKAPGGA